MRYEIEKLVDKEICFGKGVIAQVHKILNMYVITFDDPRISEVMYKQDSILYCRIVKDLYA